MEVWVGDYIVQFPLSTHQGIRNEKQSSSGVVQKQKKTPRKPLYSNGNAALIYALPVLREVSLSMLSSRSNLPTRDNLYTQILR